MQRAAGGRRVRIGLGYVKGVHEEQMRAQVAERMGHGPYKGIADIASRSGARPAGSRTPRLGRRPGRGAR